MKKTMNYVMTLLLIVECFFSFSTVVFAKNTEKSALLEKIPSELISTSELDIETVIKNKVTEASVKEEIDSLDMPQECTYNTSVYLVEYSVSTDYWDSVKTFDYEGLIKEIYTAYPTVYIPIFANIADTENIVRERAIGHIRLRYDAFDKDYRFNIRAYYNPTEHYTDKKYAGLYEAISYYLTQSETDAEQVFLIKHANSFTDGQETVAVIKTETDTIILDFYDSLHLKNDMALPEIIPSYSVEEYRTLRMELEKDLYQTVSGWENVRFGGNVENQQEDNKAFPSKYLYVLIAVSLTLIIITALSLLIWTRVKKHRKSFAETTSND